MQNLWSFLDTAKSDYKEELRNCLTLRSALHGTPCSASRHKHPPLALKRLASTRSKLSGAHRIGIGNLSNCGSKQFPH
eukprot:1159403-Pelagomonas_calceolata.AAC.1